MARRATIGVSILLALVATGSVAVAARPKSYGTENERLIANLRPFPGSRQIGLVTRKYHSAWWGWSAKYVTDSTFELSKPVSQGDLRNHYAAQLGDTWRWDPSCEGFVRDDAAVIAALDSFEPKYAYVVVDLHGRSDCKDMASVAAS